MSSYSGTAARPDRAKAIAAVAAVHAAIAFLILSGLHVQLADRDSAPMTIVRFLEPPSPPPRQPPKPPARRQRPRKTQGPPAPKAEAMPVTLPQAKPRPDPLPAANVAGPGAAQTSGAARAGSGTGAGGMGRGAGSGGYSDYSQFTPARLVQNIPNSEYRQLAATGIPSGLVGVIILVSPSGSVSNCRIARSSGDASIDSLVCELTQRYVRFDPARDPSGRPVAQEITYFPSWRRR